MNEQRHSTLHLPGRRFWLHTLLATFVVCAATLVPLGRAPADAYDDAYAAYQAGNYKRAYELWLPLARAGEPQAQHNIGHLYAEGLGVAQDFAEAVRWYRPAAENGHIMAQAIMGYYYRLGKGVPQDAVKAAQWFEIAALNGEPNAQYNLAQMYAAGVGVEKDIGQAVSWYEQAARQGDGESLARLREHAESGHTPAQLALGELHAEGAAGLERDLSTAARWYQAAARNADADAQHRLGEAYAVGNGVEEDGRAAERWLVRAALQGHTEASAKLAGLYLAGAQGLPSDPVKAFVWASMAQAGYDAAGGSSDSPEALSGALYDAFVGTDLEASAMASTVLETTKARLGADQRERAERLAAVWKQRQARGFAGVDPRSAATLEPTAQMRHLTESGTYLTVVQGGAYQTVLEHGTVRIRRAPFELRFPFHPRADHGAHAVMIAASANGLVFERLESGMRYAELPAFAEATGIGTSGPYPALELDDHAHHHITFRPGAAGNRAREVGELGDHRYELAWRIHAINDRPMAQVAYSQIYLLLNEDIDEDGVIDEGEAVRVVLEPQT